MKKKLLIGILSFVVAMAVFALIMGSLDNSITISFNYIPILIAITIMLFIIFAQIFYFNIFPKIKFKEIYSLVKQNDLENLKAKILSLGEDKRYAAQYLFTSMLYVFIDNDDQEMFKYLHANITSSKFQKAKNYWFLIESLKNKTFNEQSLITFQNSKSLFGGKTYNTIIDAIITKKITQKELDNLMKKTKSDTVKELLRTNGDSPSY